MLTKDILGPEFPDWGSFLKVWIYFQVNVVSSFERSVASQWARPWTGYISTVELLRMPRAIRVGALGGSRPANGRPLFHLRFQYASRFHWHAHWHSCATVTPLRCWRPKSAFGSGIDRRLRLMEAHLQQQLYLRTWHALAGNLICSV